MGWLKTLKYSARTSSLIRSVRLKRRRRTYPHQTVHSPAFQDGIACATPGRRRYFIGHGSDNGMPQVEVRRGQWWHDDLADARYHEARSVVGPGITGF
jgi:hypothetical protein